ncbi:hypothetical protein [Frigidibacter sp. MR17.24]|uniref:hypothetical protein n=1 Tax=Frigidibacter sp. MR17.24 TaxID=3127345 RepID=UPI003012FC1F
MGASLAKGLQALVLAAVLLPQVAPAATTEAADEAKPLTAEEFDALSVGRTLTYAAGGRVYGTEQYLPNRRVIWAFTGDVCKSGHWFPEGDEICFAYEDVADLQCWTFFQTPGGIAAKFRGDPAGDPLIAVQDSDQPLPCMPDVGV